MRQPRRDFITGLGMASAAILLPLKVKAQELKTKWIEPARAFPYGKCRAEDFNSHAEAIKQLQDEIERLKSGTQMA